MTERRIPFFFKVFLPNFSAKHLDIPHKFTRNIRCELPQKLQLIGPSRNKWNAELGIRGNRMSITKGWEEFVDDHFIKLGDFLVFRYEDSNLYVQVFDPSACEKDEAFTAKASNPVASEDECAFYTEPKRGSPKKKTAEKSSRVRKTNVANDSEYSQPEIPQENLQRNVTQKRGLKRKQPKIEPSEYSTFTVYTDSISAENLQVKVAQNASENLKVNVADIPPENIEVKLENEPVKVAGKRGRKPKVQKKDSLCDLNIMGHSEKSDSECKPPAKLLKKSLAGRGRAKKQPDNVQPYEPKVISSSGNTATNDHSFAPSDYEYNPPVKILKKIIAKRGRAKKQPENVQPKVISSSENTAMNTHSFAPSDYEYNPPVKILKKVTAKRGRAKEQPENIQPKVINSSENPATNDHSFAPSDSEYNPPAKILKKTPAKRGRVKKQPENVQTNEHKVIVNSCKNPLTAQLENAAITESYTAPLKSQRRPVTKQEMVGALEKAKTFRAVNPYTVIVMRDSYVYHHFQLNLPFSFAREHLPGTNTRMTLWDPNGRSWPVAYLYYRRRAGLRSGWSRFSYDNNLETGDVCIFELIRPDEMRVHIFRVLDEITPLVRFNPRPPVAPLSTK